MTAGLVAGGLVLQGLRGVAEFSRDAELKRCVDEAEAGFHQGVRNLREVGREVRRDLPPRERRGPQAENSPDAASNEQQLRDFFAALDAVLSEEEGAEVGKGEVLGWRLHRAGGEVLDAGLARWRSPLTTRTRL